MEFIKPKRVTKADDRSLQEGQRRRLFASCARCSVEGEDSPKAGDKVLCDIFTAQERVHVIGTSKGRGFAGLIKRHHFRGGRASHGSMFHRAPGSIGASAFPSRVIKGMRMAGHLGNDRVTVQNMRVERVDQENNLLYLRGAVPGPSGGYIVVEKVREVIWQQLISRI